MPVAALTTLGCKVNQYETEKIAEDFARAGFALADFDAPADVYVINSCSVTASADKKSRYLARKASRTNPNAVVVMTGCHAQLSIDMNEAVDGATLLVPNHEKMDVFGHVARFRPDVFGVCVFFVAGVRFALVGAFLADAPAQPLKFKTAVSIFAVFAPFPTRARCLRPGLGSLW